MASSFWAPSPFVTGFLAIGLGHLMLSTFLQYAFYRRRAAEPEQWKVQPRKADNLQGTVPQRWWLPLLGLLTGCKKPGRHPRHNLFATCNMFMASTITGAVAHLIAAGKSKVYWEEDASGLWTIGVGFAVALTWQSVWEYYWHRLMHLPAFYARLHKYHHFYKSPEPFDDLMIHPVEAFGYYVLLYSPPFLFPMPVASFGAYMVVCGMTGVLDHSGIALSMPGLYDTSDHDRHHSRFEVNYAFPFPVMDVLHGTYDGSFLGKRYSANGHCSRNHSTTVDRMKGF